MAHYYACKFGLNRLRIDGDIRQKAAITAIMENVVIAIYRLRPIQRLMSNNIIYSSALKLSVVFTFRLLLLLIIIITRIQFH